MTVRRLAEGPRRFDVEVRHLRMLDTPVRLIRRADLRTVADLVGRYHGEAQIKVTPALRDDELATVRRTVDRAADD